MRTSKVKGAREHMKALAITFGILVIGIANNAHAGQYFGAVAAGCVIDADSVANGRAVQYAGDGSVHFASGKTGTIQLTCPIPSLTCTNSLHSLYVTGQNGSGSVAHVRAIINGTGTSYATGQTIYTTSWYGSTARGATGGNFTHTFNFGNTYYWLVIELYRSSTSYDVTAWGAWLSCS